VRLWWRGDPGIESFSISYETEMEAEIWCSQLERLRKELALESAKQNTMMPSILDRQQNVNPYAVDDSDSESEKEEESEAPDIPENEALKLFHFQVMPAVESEPGYS
jgi:hypothetical protein